MKKNTPSTVHLIGNAHIDPVWLWRFPEGLSEIKATFQAAIDRIKEYDEFCFTSACAFYYQWVEENCPPLFEEIREAVAAGKWKIVGGMWIQPDCNMLSTESFARHLLYSQRYFESRFGIRVKTGYNVDSFGHSAALPKILRAAGIENYIYLRPSNGAEKAYPFPDHAFRWRCGEDEVLAFRIHRRYAEKPKDPSVLEDYDAYVSDFPYDFMLFFGVGNHGGGPTVQNIETILAHRGDMKHKFIFSHPDRYFDTLRENGMDQLPIYEGELQNHASGCYSANAAIKRYNRQCENRLVESERFGVLTAHLTDPRGIADAARNKLAWESVLFNQFHDIICGCSQKSAYEDAYAFAGSALAHAKKETNFAVQKLSWLVNTSKGVIRRSKENACRTVWETGKLGAPVVVFNPLSHEVTVPVSINRYECMAVTDENGTPIPCQRVRAEYTNRGGDMYDARFMATLPPFGWRTYWSYSEDDNACAVGEDALLSVDTYTLTNSRVSLRFDPKSGEISSYLVDGKERLGAFGARAVVINDEKNDTWSHGSFVFDEVRGVFASPVFEILESGMCEASLSVKQSYGESTLEQIYTLHPNDPAVHVRVRLFYREPLGLLRLVYDSGLKAPIMAREIPGGVIDAPANGREMPMLRYAILSENGRGIALLNDSKYSVMAKDSEIGFVLARSCYYADHYAERDGRMEMQDLGEQECRYILMPFDSDLAEIERRAEELNTVFPLIPETYHEGPLSQSGSFFASDAPNLAMTALKFAEDGDGLIVRFAETGGLAVSATVTLLGTTFPVSCEPFGIRTYRIRDGHVAACDLTEKE